MLFDVASTDPNVFVAVTLALLGSGLAACVLPARRATRVDAMGGAAERVGLPLTSGDLDPAFAVIEIYPFT